MGYAKGYIADLKMNVELLYGAYVDDLEFPFTDSNGDALDFDALGATGFEIRIYNTKGRTSKRSLLVTLTDATELSEAGGIITWNGDFPSEITEFPATYYHEVDYVDVEGKKRIGQGEIKIS